MTALVGHDPETGSKQALDEGVAGPQASPDGGRGNVLGRHIVVEEVECGGERGDVTGDIVEATGSGALEAVLGDGVADVLDGVVGDLEGVAVRVEQGAASVLDASVGLGAKRRKRGVGGRASGRIEGRGGRRGGRRGDGRIGGDITPEDGVLGASGGGHAGCLWGGGRRKRLAGKVRGGRCGGVPAGYTHTQAHTQRNWSQLSERKKGRMQDGTAGTVL